MLNKGMQAIIAAFVVILGFSIVPSFATIFSSSLAGTQGAVEGGCKVASAPTVFVPVGEPANIISQITESTVCATSTSKEAITYRGTATTMTYTKTVWTNNDFIDAIRVFLELLPAITVIGGIGWLYVIIGAPGFNRLRGRRSGF